MEMRPTLTLVILTSGSETNLVFVGEALNLEVDSFKLIFLLEKCIRLTFVERHSLNDSIQEKVSTKLLNQVDEKSWHHFFPQVVVLFPTGFLFPRKKI